MLVDGRVREQAKSSLSGGAPVTVATGPVGTALVVDGTAVYCDVTNGVMKLATDDASAPELLALDQSVVADIAIDSTSVYWTSFWSGAVMKLTPK